MTISTDRQTEPDWHTAAPMTRLPVRMAARRKAATHLLGALLPLALVLSALAACAPTQSIVKTPTATPQATATAVPQLVYQADWSHGLAGWAATPGWSVSGGMLHSDTGNDRKVTIPFHPTTPNYDVEYRVQIVRLSPTAATQYAFSADPATGLDGFVALVEHVTFSPVRVFPAHAHEMIYIDPLINQQDLGAHTIQVHDFDPGTVSRTYRIEVRGSVVTLLIDGRIASWARDVKTPQLSVGALHFYCTGIELRLSDFKVYAL